MYLWMDPLKPKLPSNDYYTNTEDILNFDVVLSDKIDDEEIVKLELAKIAVALLCVGILDKRGQVFIDAALELPVEIQENVLAIFKSVLAPDTGEMSLTEDLERVLKGIQGSRSQTPVLNLLQDSKTEELLSCESLAPNSKNCTPKSQPSKKSASINSLLNASLGDLSSPFKNLDITASPSSSSSFVEFIQSPQLVQKAVLKQKDLELRRLKQQLNTEIIMKEEYRLNAEELQATNKQKDVELEKLHQRITDLLAEKQSEPSVGEITIKLQEAEGEAKMLRERIATLLYSKDQCETLEEENKTLNEEVRKTQQEVSALQTEHRVLKEQLATMEHLESQVNTLSYEVRELTFTNERLEHDKALLQIDLEVCRESLTSHMQIEADLRHKLEEKTASEGEPMSVVLDIQVKELKKHVDKLHQERDELLQQVQQAGTSTSTVQDHSDHIVLAKDLIETNISQVSASKINENCLSIKSADRKCPNDAKLLNKELGLKFDKSDTACMDPSPLNKCSSVDTLKLMDSQPSPEPNALPEQSLPESLSKKEAEFELFCCSVLRTAEMCVGYSHCQAAADNGCQFYHVPHDLLYKLWLLIREKELSVRELNMRIGCLCLQLKQRRIENRRFYSDLMAANRFFKKHGYSLDTIVKCKRKITSLLNSVKNHGAKILRLQKLLKEKSREISSFKNVLYNKNGITTLNDHVEQAVEAVSSEKHMDVQETNSSFLRCTGKKSDEEAAAVNKSKEPVNPENDANTLNGHTEQAVEALLSEKQMDIQETNNSLLCAAGKKSDEVSSLNETKNPVEKQMDIQCVTGKKPNAETTTLNTSKETKSEYNISACNSKISEMAGLEIANSDYKHDAGHNLLYESEYVSQKKVMDYEYDVEVRIQSPHTIDTLCLPEHGGEGRIQVLDDGKTLELCNQARSGSLRLLKSEKKSEEIYSEMVTTSQDPSHHLQSDASCVEKYKSIRAAENFKIVSNMKPFGQSGLKNFTLISGLKASNQKIAKGPLHEECPDSQNKNRLSASPCVIECDKIERKKNIVLEEIAQHKSSSGMLVLQNNEEAEEPMVCAQLEKAKADVASQIEQVAHKEGLWEKAREANQALSQALSLERDTVVKMKSRMETYVSRCRDLNAKLEVMSIKRQSDETEKEQLKSELKESREMLQACREELNQIRRQRELSQEPSLNDSTFSRTLSASFLQTSALSDRNQNENSKAYMRVKSAPVLPRHHSSTVSLQSVKSMAEYHSALLPNAMSCAAEPESPGCEWDTLSRLKNKDRDAEIDENKRPKRKGLASALPKTEAEHKTSRGSPAKQDPEGPMYPPAKESDQFRLTSRCMVSPPHHTVSDLKTATASKSVSSSSSVTTSIRRARSVNVSKYTPAKKAGRRYHFRQEAN
ncbi:nuclear mitotic apparatus protein 1 [Plakobranchus ocellatus]|uniref:Nuclear mitotic apparatus protein 1 n=1 Tax=Plakobranchus ocellatus TaxID=259542 RepID=A0AAV3Y6C2_9GAST|nr:nuclear mitotic apparatus protein 1 [Plakobranchus ocellatus]